MQIHYVVFFVRALSRAELRGDSCATQGKRLLRAAVCDHRGVALRNAVRLSCGIAVRPHRNTQLWKLIASEFSNWICGVFVIRYSPKSWEPKDKPQFVEVTLPKVFSWARQAHPSQPLTSGAWDIDFANGLHCHRWYSRVRSIRPDHPHHVCFQTLFLRGICQGLGPGDSPILNCEPWDGLMPHSQFRVRIPV